MGELLFREKSAPPSPRKKALKNGGMSFVLCGESVFFIIEKASSAGSLFVFDVGISGYQSSQPSREQTSGTVSVQPTENAV